jgi:hypothetical protein
MSLEKEEGRRFTRWGPLSKNGSLLIVGVLNPHKEADKSQVIQKKYLV